MFRRNDRSTVRCFYCTQKFVNSSFLTGCHLLCIGGGGLNQTTALICNILVGFYEMKTYLLMKLRSVPYMNNDNVLHNLSLFFFLVLWYKFSNGYLQSL